MAPRLQQQAARRPCRSRTAKSPARCPGFMICKWFAASVVAIDALAPLMALLGFDRLGGDRMRLETAQRNRLAGLLAIAVSAVVDARERLVDLGDQLALAVAGAQLDGAVRLRRRPVGKIGMILVLFLQVLQGFLGFLEDVFAPGQELRAKVIALALVHERLFVRRPVVFVLRQHPTALPWSSYVVA